MSTRKGRILSELYFRMSLRLEAALLYSPGQEHTGHQVNVNGYRGPYGVTPASSAMPLKVITGQGV